MSGISAWRGFAGALMPGAATVRPAACLPGASAVELLDISCDPARELHAGIDPCFEETWKQRTGRDLARAVIGAPDAEAVTPALAPDIDTIFIDTIFARTRR